MSKIKMTMADRKRLGLEPTYKSGLSMVDVIILLCSSSEPLGYWQVAERVGIKEHTARRYLEALAERFPSVMVRTAREMGIIGPGPALKLYSVTDTAKRHFAPLCDPENREPGDFAGPDEVVEALERRIEVLTLKLRRYEG